ncbi:hypothetical protein KP509_38G055000 [Ceratopteris richardii]|nr:hypothetical protein KP509_38G055000 [Ceratopteris richardii]
MTAPVLTTDEAVHSEKISMTAPVLTCQEEGLPEKIEMTAPVLSSQEEGHAEKISMTAPVLTEEKPADGGSGGGKSGMMVMQFVLPSKYKCLDDVPRPTDPRVRVKEVSPRKYGVTTFSGIASEKLVEVKVSELEKSLHEAGYKVTGRHVLAQYNPPWTIPFLRKNEVMVPLE